MDFSDKLFGAYISDPINLRRFKMENPHSFHQTKLSKITNRSIIAKVQSINPNLDLSNALDDIKLFEEKLKKYNFQNLFNSPDALNARCLLPIYDTVNNDLQVLKVVKSDLYQTKRIKMYAQPPLFTPRGYIVPGQSLLITVSLYYPFHWAKDQEPDEAVIPHFNEAIQFHDAQTLRDVKQAFRCENENSEISGDISENPNKPFGN